MNVYVCGVSACVRVNPSPETASPEIAALRRGGVCTPAAPVYIHIHTYIYMYAYRYIYLGGECVCAG